MIRYHIVPTFRRKAYQIHPAVVVSCYGTLGYTVYNPFVWREYLYALETVINHFGLVVSMRPESVKTSFDESHHNYSLLSIVMMDVRDDGLMQNAVTMMRKLLPDIDVSLDVYAIPPSGYLCLGDPIATASS